MASIFVEGASELNQLFREISSKFSPAESEDVVQASKRIYGEQFNSLGNQDLLSCLDRFHKLGYVSNTKLTLIKEFVATKSLTQGKNINDTIEKFKASHRLQAEPEKKLQGRSNEIREITEKLQMGQPPVVNLYGSAGVGKTTLAKEVCALWRGKSYVFDLREAIYMRAIYLNILDTLELTVPVGHLSMVDIVGRIHDQIEKTREGQLVLFLLDNVEQSTKGEGKRGKNLRMQFMQFLGKLSGFDDKGKTRKMNILLTSRTQLNNSETVVGYELKPLKYSFSEKIILPMETSSIMNAQQKEELLGICKGVPLLLKGAAAILRQGRKSPSDLIAAIKLEADAKEKPFDFQEGVDEGQTILIKEMFDTLPSDSLRVSAVSVSLFCGPFPASTAANILGISPSEAVAQLEGLVTNGIIYVVNEEAKTLMYDIHPLLRKYADSITSDAKLRESYIEAKGRFYKHFMSKMEIIAGFIEYDYVKAYNQFAIDRANYEFAIDISLLPEYFRVESDEFHERALMASLFNAMLSGEKQTELFHSWAEMCKDDGKSGSLFRAQLRCWEAQRVLDVDGTHEAFKVLQQAALSLEQVQDQSTESFKLTQGLFLYFEGEIHCQNRDYKQALEYLRSSLDLMEGPLKLDTNLARCYNAVGNCYYRLNKLEKALEFYNKALKMREQLSGSEYHYDMPGYKNQIGTIHEDQGEYYKAVNCYKDALRLLKELKLSGYEDEAHFRRNLANVYVRQGKYREAIEPAEKAYHIRIKRLGKHPETVQSIFQLGVIQTNLRAFDKALVLFLKAWDMEKSLKAGNHSDVWKLIITGVNDMCDYLNKNIEKEEFRQDAVQFCQRFWKDQKASAHFAFTAYNEHIIDVILVLLVNKGEERVVRKEYEKEALWFYDGMLIVTEEDFYKEVDQERHNKVLNEILNKRIGLLDKTIDFCHRRHEHVKLIKYRRNKLTLCTKVLKWLDFVGDKGLEKAELRSVVEQLYKDLGEKGSITEFREDLLGNWQQQWEDMKGAEESRNMLVARKRTIEEILQLCKELTKEELRRRYTKEALSFYERLWEVKHAEMKPAVMKAYLRYIKDLALSIGDRESVKVYRDALQTLRQKKQPGATLRPKESQMLQMEERPGSDSDEEEEIEVGSEEELEVEFEEILIHLESEEGIEVESEEDTEAGGDSSFDNRSVIVFKGTVTREGAHWPIELGAVHLMFPPNAVSEPTSIVVHEWKSSACSPQLMEHEAIVSNVIEISTNTGQALEFNAAVKLFLSHSAPDLQGYELVIQRQIDKESNEWEDVGGTEDLRSLSDIKDGYSSLDFFFPVAQADITECSTYTVVCRLKSSPPYTITSTGGTFSHPNYPGVTVIIPEGAVAPKAKFPLKLKVQEVLSEEFEGQDVFVGPVLRIICPQVVEFLKPVTIQLPISFQDEQEAIPDPSTCRVRVLFLRTHGEDKEWIEITGDLLHPASFDGKFVRFEVERFSGYGCFLDWCKESAAGIICFLSSLIWNQPRLAVFFVYFLPHSHKQLHLICSPAHLRGQVILEIDNKDITPSEKRSNKTMIPGRSKAFVFLSGGITPVDVKGMEGFHLMFESNLQCKKQLRVRLSSDQDRAQVEFRSTPEPEERNLLCTLNIERTSRIPSEILARGLTAKLAYTNALKTGKVKVNRARIMLIGQDRAGKTSLRKSFLGLPFDPNEQSTDGIEVDPSKFEVAVDQVKNWQRIDRKPVGVSQFLNDHVKMVAGELQKENTIMDQQVEDEPKETSPKENKAKMEARSDEDMSEKTQDDPKETEFETNQVPIWEEKKETETQEARVGHRSHQMVSHSENADRKPAIPEVKIDPPKEFTGLLVKCLNGENLPSDDISLDLWDFAGQHLYYASYPVFLSSRAVYMLVYNLSKRLKNTAQPCARQGINEILLSNPNHETNLENLLSWLVSVTTYSSKPEATTKDLPYVRPPVFIVGTHADKPHQDIKEMELQIEKEISGKDYDDHVIRPFFSVDNTQGSSGKGVSALQNQMFEVLKQEPYMGEEVPLRWFKFEKVIQDLVAEKTYYLTLEQLQAIIQKVCYIENENEAATMLDFYHDLGVIVKHHNTVVLQAQWLINVFKQLITIRSFSDMKPRHSKLWKEMEATGVLSVELVDHVFSKFCHDGAVKEDILNMMEQFGLIVKFATSPSDVQFFVPCQLKTPPQVEPSPSPSDPCTLYLHFPGGFVPHGLFSQLVSRCTRWCSVSGFKQPPNLFDGASRFFIEKELSHQLILVCKKKFIKVVLMQTQPDHEASFAEIKEMARLVRKFLEETMENLTHELPWLSNLTYDLCVACPNCPTGEKMCSNHGQTSCTDEECLCLLKILDLDKGQLKHCPNNFNAEVPTVPGLEKWFLIKAVRPVNHLGTDDVYKMTALPRGITLIINNKVFANHPEHGQQSTRHGSEEDVRRVKALFYDLGFQVHAKENLTRLQFLNELDSVAYQDHSNYDCFVLWLMSHGKSGEMYCSDGVTLPIHSAHDMLSNCKTLTGKPKLFFIQTCRGDDEDVGVAVSADSPGTSAEENRSASRISPTHADCLYAYSTVDGYVSYRNLALGSYYVQALVDVFRERTAHDDLLGILTNVNRTVSEMVTNKGYKQMPEVRHTLLKKLRF